MDFRLLQNRLVYHLRERVRNGEISERALARISGVSQPHIHNVLKGPGLFSMDMADQILRRLRIDLAALMSETETGCRPSKGAGGLADWQPVSIMNGWIGREHPYPQSLGRERYPFLSSAIEGLESPVVVWLAPDRRRGPIFSGRDVVLLDRSEEVRLHPDEESYFALDLSGSGTIALVRRAKRRIYLWAGDADEWQAIPLPDRDPLDVIRGRVRLLVRQY